MSLSFEDSLKMAQAKETETNNTNNVANANIASTSVEPAIMTLNETNNGIAAYDGDDGNWVQHGDYVTYLVFSDENLSIIDEDKNIILHEKQFNITQEENSQYIPFEMNRYYDGYDLTNARLSIHYETELGRHGVSKPVNVDYNNRVIRFGWLVDSGATLDAGKLKFEIHAYGTVTGGDRVAKSYVWKSKCNENLNVLQSLCDCEDVVNKIDDSWMQELVTDIATKVGEDIKDIIVEGEISPEDIRESVETIINEKDFATEQYVDDAVAGVDVSDQLQNYVTKVDLNANYYTKAELEWELADHLEHYAMKDYVDSAIADADISGKLVDYYTKEETYNRTEIDEKIANVEVDLSGYYTKSEVYNTSEVDTKISNQSSRLDVVEAELNTIGNLVSDVTESATGIEVYYSDGTSKTVDTQDTSVKVEDVNQIESGLSIVYTDGSSKEIEITGGGGGSVTSGSATITRITDSSIQCRYGDECPIEFEFTAVDSAGDIVGDGTATWYVGNVKKTTSVVVQGKNSFDISKYLSVGNNNVKVSVSVDTGGESPVVVTKTWTVNAVNLYLVWNYDDTTVNTSDTVAIRWTPYGNLSKTTHVVIDGTEVTTSTTTRSGVEQYVTVNKYSHGSHMVELYLTAEVNGKEIRSESVFHDMIFADANNNTTVISSSLPDSEMTQYNTMRIPVVIYNPASLTSNAVLKINDEQVGEWTDVDRTIHYWNYTPSDYGEKTLTITSNGTVKTLKITVNQLDIDNEEIQGYAFRLKASDFAGNEALRSWNSNGVTLEFSDNFDWNNGGIKTELDENGNIQQFICVKAGTTATIDYLLFNNDAKVNGKNFKVIFKATNSRDHDAVFLSCMDNGIGVELGANGGTASSGQNTLNVQYREDSYVEFEYDVSPAPTDTNTNTYRYIQTYLDGVLTSTNIYAVDDQFKQSNPQKIVIGSPDCDVNIYLVKVYESYLTRDNHIENFIADAPNAQEMVARYNRNDVLNDSGEISYEKLAQKNPNARIHLWSIPRMTEGKKDYVTGCSYQQIYNAGDARHQLTANNVTINIQGTSSVDYKDSGANTDGHFTEGFTDGNGNHIDTYSMSDNSIGVNYFNTKVNIASCENVNNMCLAEWYNRYQPYKTAYRLKNLLARDCMEHNIGVQFIHDQSHTLFSDDNYHMYAICNMGNSKNNSAVFHDLENPNECCIETKDNNSTHCMMLDPSFDVADLDSEDFFEFRYPESPTDEMKNAFVRLVRWFANGNPAGATGNALSSSVTFEPYTFRGTGQEGEVLAGLTIDEYAGTYTHDTYEYRMAKMLSECEDYLVMDSMVYHYVFIEQHAMVDNVCKNTFWGTEDLVHWQLAKNYDNDTGDGNSNTGKLIIPFGSEGYDDLDGSPIFNGRDNVYWRFIYGLYEARRVMWQNRETAGAWNAEAYLTFAKERQNYLPERVYNQDYWYKYLRLYEEKAVTTYIPMLEGGKKSHQRESFVTNNLYYMAGQYMGTACTSKSITLRGYTPSEWSGVEPKAQVTVMLYNKGYVVVQIGSIYKRVKADKGAFYTVEFPESGNMNDTVINIHGANWVQAVGDISCLYPGRSDYSAATRIRSIQIGSTADGYKNHNLIEVGFGTNTMLEELYIQNCPNIQSTLDLSGCQALRKLDIRGSGFTGVVFAVGGLIESALLCSPSSLNMRSLYALTDAGLSLETYDNLSQIRLEDCSGIDSLAFVNNAANLSIVRILGVDWQLENTALLNRLYNMDGLNENNIATEQSVLAGTVTVPNIGQYELYNYQSAWPNLTIVSNIINQYVVKFVNYDGTVLDTQYIDQFGDAVNPITREENPIPTPVRESTIEHQYEFAGWDSNFTYVQKDTTVTATYTESLRKYTVKYVSKGVVLNPDQEPMPYGSYVPYEGDTPVYTAGEPYTFHLFNRWDKSGYVDGDKTINAIFDSFEYKSFSGRELKDLSPVEIYALQKLTEPADKTLSDFGMVIDTGDDYSFTMGYDIDYDDIESEVLISEKTVYNGSTYNDTGIKLFDVDKDFVLALDYKMSSANSSGATLVQCLQTAGTNGFKLSYDSSPKFTWGNSSITPASADKREMLVIRHKSGDNNLYVYVSNLSSTDIQVHTIEKGLATHSDTATLVFGAEKFDSGRIDNYAQAEIYFAKLWYKDLGDDVCRMLSGWTHEQITLEASGFYRYQLYDDSSKESMVSLLATHLLDVTRPYNTTNTNVGGWSNSTLNSYLNERFYKAMPQQIQVILKKMDVKSVSGHQASEPLATVSSGCYVTIPALYDIDDDPSINIMSTSYTLDQVKAAYRGELYDGANTIDFFTGLTDAQETTNRKRAFNGGTSYHGYWLRSPALGGTWSNGYVWRVDENGNTQQITSPTNNDIGILIEISF